MNLKSFIRKHLDFLLVGLLLYAAIAYLPDQSFFDRQKIPALQAAAMKGDIAAQSKLADCYYYGIGVPTDVKSFLKWGKAAAGKGDPHAQVLLGYYYMNYTQHYDEGLKWARLSADQHWPRGERFMGYLYSSGIGVKTDHQKAIEWWLKAAAQGDDGAAINLGRYYSLGIGVLRNDREAMKWYGLAGEYGSHKAKFLSLALFLKTLISSNNQGTSRNDAVADDKEKTKFKIGSADYFKPQILRDFLSAAFSNTLWNEQFNDEKHIKWQADMSAQLVREYGFYSGRDVSDGFEKIFTSDAPWLWPYVTHPNGFPKHNVLNKWTKEITIAIGWPEYKVNQSYDVLEQPPRELTPEDMKEYDLIRQQVEKLIPDLKKLTGLSVRFVPREDKSDRTQDFARIRIIPATVGIASLKDGLRWTSFKRGKGYGSLTFTSMWTFRPYLDDLVGAVEFTPYAKTELDGFLLPDPDNSIGMAVCNVTTGLSDDLTKSMVTECLARAVGIPEAVKSSDDILLGAWNKAYAKLVENAIEFEKMQLTKGITFLKPEQLKEYSDMARTYDAFQPYDRAMIKLLYCPALKPQMDKLQVIEGLLGSDECFSRLGEMD